MMKKILKEKGMAFICILVISCELLLALAGAHAIFKENSLDFYSDIYSEADSNSIQFFYSYGEEFIEEHSVVTSSLTEQKDGYSIDLSGIDIKNIQLVRMDYIAEDGQVVTAEELVLRAKGKEIQRIPMGDDVWKNCIHFNSMEYLGENRFRITGFDPYIIFGAEIAGELRESYVVFNRMVNIFFASVFVVAAVLEILFRNKIKTFFIKSYNYMKEKIKGRSKYTVSTCVFVGSCYFILLLMGIYLVKSSFKLNFYTDAYYASGCARVQLFYNYGEEFSEEHSVITSDMTKLKDGYIVDLGGVDVKNIQSVRMDYFLERERGKVKKVSAQGFTLEFLGVTIKKIDFNSVWDGCSINDMKYLGNEEFKITGSDPYIVFGEGVAKDIRASYSTVYYSMVILLAVLFIVVLAARMRLWNIIQAFFSGRFIRIGNLEKIGKIGNQIAGIHIGLCFSDILHLYDILYPIILILIGLNLEKKGLFQIDTNLGWIVIKAIIFFSFVLWIKVRFSLGRKKEDGLE